MLWKKREIINGAKTHKAFNRLNAEIKKSNGLHFDLKIDEDGWFAQCKEFSGIITGGSNTKPSQKEIMESILDSIKTAFHIPAIDEESKELQVKTIHTQHREERQLEVCV